jgi:tripartite-type tricarboxylate transporter receptor subunit TctC
MRTPERRTTSAFVLICAAVASIAPAASFAQPFPAKPVRIVTAEPGGGNELAARIIAQDLTVAFGQQVIVESRGGANAALAALAVAKAPPDGYTWLLYSSALWVIPLIKDVPWDVARDFAPVVLIAQAPNVLVVHPSLPARSVTELIKLARARPGELNYSSGASAAAAHLSAELFKSLSKIDIVRVRYKGTGPGLVALVSGEVQLMFPVAGAVGNYVKTGKLRALAVTSAQRSALAPELPTMAEAGLPGYEAVSVYGLFAPVKTPAALIARMSDGTIHALQSPEVKQRFFNAGVETIAAPGERLQATMRADLARWGKLIREAGIRDE